VAEVFCIPTCKVLSSISATKVLAGATLISVAALTKLLELDTTISYGPATVLSSNLILILPVNPVIVQSPSIAKLEPTGPVISTVGAIHCSTPVSVTVKVARESATPICKVLSVTPMVNVLGASTIISMQVV
jgi:hypothetical protein